MRKVRNGLTWNEVKGRWDGRGEERWGRGKRRGKWTGSKETKKRRREER